VLYGSPGVGNELHLATELFVQKAGITTQHIPYKGASEVMTALLGGSVDVMFVTPPSVIGLIRQGTVRAIAFTGKKPFPEFLDAPLMKDALPGYEGVIVVGHVLRAGKNAKRDRGQTERGDPRRRAGAGPCQSAAARRLFSGQPQCRGDRGVLPPGSRRRSCQGEGRRDRGELERTKRL